MMHATGGPTLAQLGPVRMSEPRLSRRIRVHQAWYRYAILGEADFGATRPPTSRPLGSILPPRAAQDFRNLIGPAAITAYQKRRMLGWGVDPVRTLGYLTSSQAMTINLFGALQSDLTWCRDVLSSALGPLPKIQSVSEVEIEYFSRYPSQALGDRTTVDVLVRAQTDEGPMVISVETKLGDRFNSRAVKLGSAYLALHHLWPDPTEASRQEFSQLARAHALAEHISLKSAHNESPKGRVLLIHHPEDEIAIAIARDYRCVVSDPATVCAQGLDSFLALMSKMAPDQDSRNLVDSLIGRYVDMSGSELVWQEFQATIGRRGSAKASR